jgi:predicted site-specific integrase-resolvase
MLVSIGQAACLIGVSVSTLRRWEREERLQPSCRTKGQHRRYRLSDIQSEFFGLKTKPTERVQRKVLAYARVSSHGQKDDLKRQIETLKDFCQKENLTCEVISDLGSGINFNKRGLNQLISEICAGKVGKLILTHRDRLLRFGTPLIFKLCHFYETEIIVLGNEEKNRTFEAELVADVIELMTVYTSKVYGRRAHAKRKQLSAKVA